MKANRFSAAQIIPILREAEAGKEPIEALCRQPGSSEATFYRWRSQSGGLDPSAAARLTQLDKENARWKKLLAERDREVEMLKEINAKKG